MGRISRLPLLAVGGALVCALLFLIPAVPLPWRSEPPVEFVRDIQPIFKARCLKCHDWIKRRGQLRLDSGAHALHGGVSGKVIVPGNSRDSRLVQLITAADPEERMPQKGEPLSPEQIRLIRTWIDAGAQWPASAADATFAPHWAYQKPIRPEAPAVRQSDWVRNPIDAFVLARLERESLRPSPEAPRATLIRRVSLDLTGLPPSLAEVDAFLADPSPDAYEKVVDRLLASPHYGERWARPWLDLARYADTNGGSADSPRKMWPFRDWVIDALNRDLPFDRFTIEQLAGDLLPGATPEQQVATGFHVNAMQNDEDGLDLEEVRWEMLVDRVNTTATVWLGATLACAQCHNHKYDPFTQREYYRLLAFFDNAREVMAGGRGVPAMVMSERQTSKPPSTYLRIRGSFAAKGPKVEAGAPRALHPMRSEWPLNRLGLAYWLVDRENPLVARVAVNRFWGEFFGRPLVETAEDFGTQGRPPSHPELLDWLATEFVRLDFSMKAVHRVIATSATYRQASRVTPEVAEKDPENRLLARGPRFRMEAEMIRDVTLAASGLLSRKIGGPSVFPPEPDNVGFIANNRSRTGWVTSDGEDRHRRGLYTFWRRTAPYPGLASFDAPSREVTTVRRPRTNTPLQALTALNDPAFVEAARGLARRMVREAAETPRARAAHGFRLCLARAPEPDELDQLVRAYARERDHFASARQAAARLLADLAPEPEAGELPELAAWTVVASVLLNLDETLTKE